MIQYIKQLKGCLFLLFVLLFPALAAQAQQITVHGTVIEAEHHTPLIGVNIGIKGTSKGAVTDTLGNYEVTAPSP